jgi:hypothetical protein
MLSTVEEQYCRADTNRHRAKQSMAVSSSFKTALQVHKFALLSCIGKLGEFWISAFEV